MKKWVADNLSLGGIVKHAFWAGGKVAKGAVKGSALVASAAVKDPNSKKALHDFGDSVGGTLDRGVSATGRHAGRVINKAVEATAFAAGYAFEGGAKLAGASPEAAEKARVVGTFVGAGAVGLVTGVAGADALVAASAAAGTSGAAATASGLAALGGGSIAAGGGGMAAGQVVVNTIVATSTASGAATMVDDEKPAG